MLLNFPHGERFALILADHLLHSLAISTAAHDLPAYLRRLLCQLLKEGGVAVLGAWAGQAPRERAGAAPGGCAVAQFTAPWLPGAAPCTCGSQ